MSVSGMLTGGLEDVEVIPTKSISSVQVRHGSWYHDVTVYASGNTMVFSVDAADAERLKRLILERITYRAGGPVRSGCAGADQEAGELRDAGILTDAEFETKKAALLERL